MGSSHDGAEELLQLYEQLQGQAPADAPPALKELFDDISKSQRAALKDKLDDKDTQTIFPTPRFVVKTTDEGGQKVFINVCSSDKISAPSSWAHGAMPDSVRQALHNLDSVKSEEDVQAMRVPLSLSEQRIETDKSGTACLVFDCVFAEEVMKEATTFRPMKIFIIECCLGWIQHKCQVTLDQKFKLPKLRYKGDTIHQHLIRKEKKKLVTEIEEVIEDDKPSLPLLTKKPAKGAAKLAGEHSALAGYNRANEQPKGNSDSTWPAATQAQSTGANDSHHTTASACLIDIKYEGSPCKQVLVNIKMNSHILKDSLERLVKVDLSCIHVCPEQGPPLVIPLNVYVNPDTCQCKLQGEVLRVVLDYMSVDDILQLAKDRRPLNFGTVGLQSHQMLRELD